MKKLIALMTTAVLAASFTTSCQLKHYDPYDEDNAQKLAIEYMKEKYDKEIEVTDTYCQKHGSDKYVGVNFKLDETDNESSDDNTYEVRVYGDKDEQKQYVKCDNYMNTLFAPFMEDEIGQILEKNGINDYMLTIDDIDQWVKEYYTTDFRIPSPCYSLESYFDNYKIIFYCYISLPDSQKSQISSTQNCIDYISDKIKVIFDDDHMHLRVDIFHDSEFELVKMGNSKNYKSYDYYREFI